MMVSQLQSAVPLAVAAFALGLGLSRWSSRYPGLEPPRSDPSDKRNTASGSPSSSVAPQRVARNVRVVLDEVTSDRYIHYLLRPATALGAVEVIWLGERKAKAELRGASSYGRSMNREAGIVLTNLSSAIQVRRHVQHTTAPGNSRCFWIAIRQTPVTVNGEVTEDEAPSVSIAEALLAAGDASELVVSFSADGNHFSQRIPRNAPDIVAHIVNDASTSVTSDTLMPPVAALAAALYEIARHSRPGVATTVVSQDDTAEARTAAPTRQEKFVAREKTRGSGPVRDQPQPASDASADDGDDDVDDAVADLFAS